MEADTSRTGGANELEEGGTGNSEIIREVSPMDMRVMSSARSRVKSSEALVIWLGRMAEVFRGLARGLEFVRCLPRVILATRL